MIITALNNTEQDTQSKCTDISILWGEQSSLMNIEHFPIKREGRRFRHNHRVVDFDFIGEASTVPRFRKQNVVVCGTKTIEATFIFNIEIIKEGPDEILEEDNNMNAVANNFLTKIEHLDKQGKKQQSIKEAHKLFENLLNLPDNDIANQVLKQSININFSLGVFIAILASTLPFKNELKDRELVFEKAEKIAISELGAEKLGSTIFKNLK